MVEIFKLYEYSAGSNDATVKSLGNGLPYGQSSHWAMGFLMGSQVTGQWASLWAVKSLGNGLPYGQLSHWAMGFLMGS